MRTLYDGLRTCTCGFRGRRICVGLDCLDRISGFIHPLDLSFFPAYGHGLPDRFRFFGLGDMDLYGNYPLSFDAKNLRNDRNDERVSFAPCRLRSIHHAIGLDALDLRMSSAQLLLENFVVRVDALGDADAAGHNRCGARMQFLTDNRNYDFVLLLVHCWLVTGSGG